MLDSTKEPESHVMEVKIRGGITLVPYPTDDPLDPLV